MNQGNNHNTPYDWCSLMLTPEQMGELNKTPEGKERLREYFTRARCAMGMQEVMARLSLQLTPEQQAECCYVLYECVLKVPPEHVLVWIHEAADHQNMERDTKMDC